MTNLQSVLTFDGQDDYVATTLDAQPSALPAITWEAWVKPTRNINNWEPILSTDDGGWDRGVSINAGRFRIYHGTGAWNAVEVDINQWQHIAVVYAADKQVKFYKNGTEYIYSGRSSVGSTKNRLHIGRSSGNGAYCFQGSITEVRVWNYVRETADIQRDMNHRLKGNEPGLVGYWPLNEGNGVLAQDKSSNDHNGNISGATWEKSELSLASQPKQNKTESVQTILTFDGVDDYVSLPISSIPAGKEISISFWSKGGSLLPNSNSVFFANAPNFNYIVNIHLPWSNSNIYFDCGSDGPNYNRIQKTAQATDFKDTWTHWAFTLNANAGKMVIYLNGELWCEGNDKALSIPKASQAFLGKGLYGYYHGSLSDVRVWDRELTPAEIKDTMSVRLTGKETGLVGYWPLDDGGGIQVTDKSGHGNHGTIDGATWETGEVPVRERAGTVSFSRQQSQGTGLKDYTYWYHWEKSLPQQTDKKPFRRGRIWC